MAPRSVYGACAWGNGTDLTLSDTTNAGYNTKDVPNIPNIFFGETPPAASNFLDETQPGKLKTLPLTGLLRGGFVVSPIASGVIEEGKTVPLGMLETAYIIRHRNIILRDSGISLPVPLKSSTQSEFENLTALIAAANTAPGSGYRYYYPAASYAYAYEPVVKQGETLHEKFRAHRWFLPTPGDAQMARCVINMEGSPFAKAEILGVFIASGYIHTTGEHQNAESCYKMNIRNGIVYTASYGYMLKSNSNSNVLPMVQF